jgi:hypothetical protein
VGVAVERGRAGHRRVVEREHVEPAVDVVGVDEAVVPYDDQVTACGLIAS